MKYVSVLLSLGCLLSSVSAQWLETTIQLDSAAGPWALCYSTQSDRVYSANLDQGTVTVIDGATNQIIKTVTTGAYAWVLCYNPTNDKVYCANAEGNSVTIIDGATDSVIANLGCDGPRALCYNSHDNRIYSANEWGVFNNAVAVIDGRTNQIVGGIYPGLEPCALCYNSCNNKVYCATLIDDHVVVADGSTNQIIDTVMVGEEPLALFYSPENNKIYCSNYDSYNVSVIDGATDSVIHTLAIWTKGGFCYRPRDNALYCPDLNTGNVLVIDAATDSLLDTVFVEDAAAVNYNLLNDKLYCAERLWYDDVKVIDCATNQVSLTIPVGSGPAALCHNPRENRMYVANYTGASISVLRDSGGGIEESSRAPAPGRELGPTVVRSLPQRAVAFDAMGRRVVNPMSGIYFVRDEGRGTGDAGRTRKVILQR